MRKIIAALLLIVGVIHLLPLAGVVGADRLAALYGIRIDEPDLVILMRHRAVLFGLLGAFLCYAAFHPLLQPLALIGGFASVLSFLWFAWSTGGYNPMVGRVVMADVIALACLIVAAVLYALDRSSRLASR